MNRAVFTVDECLLEMVNVERTLSGLFCLLLHVFQIILKKVKNRTMLSKNLWKGK